MSEAQRGERETIAGTEVKGGLAPIGASADTLAHTAGLEHLADRARGFARAERAEATRRAYDADWRHFEAWCARHRLAQLPPDPAAIGLYITALATEIPRGRKEPLNVRSIERRLSGLRACFEAHGHALDRSDPQIKTVLAGIKRAGYRPPEGKEALLADDLVRMLGMLDKGLRGLRDRALLLVCFAGGLRRSEVVGLDCGPDESDDGTGWIERLPAGLLLRIYGKTGWREVEIGPGSAASTCPVAALEEWLRIARIARGPVFRRVAADGKTAMEHRLTGQHVARLVQQTAAAAGIRSDLAEGRRRRAFSGHSLRAGLATAAEAEERDVQRQLGHATIDMTRRYQRNRQRFRKNLTKAAGL